MPTRASLSFIVAAIQLIITKMTATLRKEFAELVNELLVDSDSDDTNSEEDIEQLDTERYNNNDEDLTNYVREFKTKVTEG